MSEPRTYGEVHLCERCQKSFSLVEVPDRFIVMAIHQVLRHDADTELIDEAFALIDRVQRAIMWEWMQAHPETLQ